MKVTREQKYPYYGKHKTNGSVVKFIKESLALPVHDPNGVYLHTTHALIENHFTPIPNPFEEEKFESITITLNTEEEALAMWAKLNVPSEQAIKYATQEGVNVSQATCFVLFNEFDEVFDPHK